MIWYNALYAMGFQERIQSPYASRYLEGLRNSVEEFIPLNGMLKITSKPALDWNYNQRQNSRLVYALAALGNDTYFLTIFISR